MLWLIAWLRSTLRRLVALLMLRSAGTTMVLTSPARLRLLWLRSVVFLWQALPPRVDAVVDVRAQSSV